MAKMKCPYTYPAKSRKQMVDYICDIGGYYDRGDRWPVEFNVSTHQADLDVDTLWKTATEHGEVSDREQNDPVFRAAFDEAYKEIGDRLWADAVNDAAQSVLDGDNAALQMLWDGTELEVGMDLRGRCGKHLVLTTFNGFRLEGYSSEALHEALMLQRGPYGEETYDEDKLRKGWEWEVSLEFIRRLYKYVRQCEVDITPRKVADEIEYLAASRVTSDAEQKFLEMQQEIADKAVLTEHARTVGAGLDDDDSIASWKALCLAAGITPPKL